MARKEPRYVYFFGNGRADGNGKMKDLLGGKGAGLAEMTSLGVPVPAGFTITTEVCNYFYEHKQKLPLQLNGQIKKALVKIEKSMGKKFGDKNNLLLVSVRSGAKFSMPGMMDTVLNLGLNDESVEGLAQKTGNRRFALDSYRRFIQMFGNVVLEIDKEIFEEILSDKKKEGGVKLDTQLAAEALEDVIVKFKQAVKQKAKINFPQDPFKQLEMSRDAVFNSWNNPRAKTYRKLNKIPDNLGTAVNIQAMVFGNMGETSATGVGFTRNPSTGEKVFYGEYLINAQGEDVVAGVRTPHPINDLAKQMPKIYKQLRQITGKLEKHYRDVQDFEFTVEDNKLFMLQTRIGKRTGFAAIRIAVDMVKEGLINKREALMRVNPEQINQLLHPIFDPKERFTYKVIAKGLAASPGAASGKVVFTADEAVAYSEKGEKVILVRTETCPDDIHGMHAAQGILTARGGMTSHAAVVGRGMGKTCVVGCGAITINEKQECFSVGEIKVNKDDFISIDGNTGQVILGKIPTQPSEVLQVFQGKIQEKKSNVFQYFKSLMKWANEIREIGIRANADIPTDAKVAFQFGAEGIGLCRTEHMFFASDRLPVMQEMILAETEEGRRKALDKLLLMQKKDFYGLFKEMKGHPVIIRTLDPPLHEFLPKREDLMVEVALAKGRKQKLNGKEKILARVEKLHELNPMLGHRGCRLGITYPEITEMQVRAIIEAACKLAKEGKKVLPEIMIPLVGHVNELKNQKEIAVKIAEETIKKYKVKVKYMIGTMIEIPRAALTADEIAQEAEFFSFGTNDMTQMGFGFSRDDAGAFIAQYLEKKIFTEDPFQTLDQGGIGKLMQIGIDNGRRVKKNLEVGICGEHGGDPESVKFCHRVGMNYVSCSPYRVPVACLAAAQGAIESPRKSAVKNKKSTKKVKRRK